MIKLRASFKNLLLIMTALAITGCTNTMRNPARISQLDVGTGDDNKARIILSTGAANSCISGYPVTLNIKNTSNRKSRAGFTVTNYFLGKDFEEDHGFLHGASLAPGDYELDFTVVGKQTTDSPYAKFTLKENEWVYLGQYYLDGECGAFANNNNIYIRDKSARDLKKAKELNPELDVSNVKIQVLSFESILPDFLKN